MGIVAIIAAVVSLGVLAILFWQVDDWRRDLSTNEARTDDDAPQEALRPIDTPLSPAEVAYLVEETVRTLPRWQQQARTQHDARITYHFIRTTPLMRFKDDIHLAIEPHAAGSRITAESRSRLGRGDLGQNPRNLKEILAPLRTRLIDAAQRKPD